MPNLIKSEKGWDMLVDDENYLYELNSEYVGGTKKYWQCVTCQC
jgi:hypothetical protein